MVGVALVNCSGGCQRGVQRDRERGRGEGGEGKGVREGEECEEKDRQKWRREERQQGNEEATMEHTFSISTHQLPSSSQLFALKMFLLSGPSIVNIASSCFPFVDTSGVGIGPSVHPARAREMVGTARGEDEVRYSWRFPEGVRTKKAVRAGSQRKLERAEEGRTGFPGLDEPLLALEDAFPHDGGERVIAVGVRDLLGLAERSGGGDEVVELGKVVPFGLRWGELLGQEEERRGRTSGETESTLAERKTERCWFVRWRWELRSRGLARGRDQRRRTYLAVSKIPQ